MTKSRLEAFSDGVLAIIITVMVIDLKSPEIDSLQAVFRLIPNIASYILSFTYVAIYWNNHHQLLSSTNRVNAKILWANSLWLFFMSLIPFVTGWISRFYSSHVPVMTYGLILLVTALSYFFLQHQVVKYSERSALLKKIIGKDLKGKFTVLLYIISILMSPFFTTGSEIIFVIAALMWFIPDKRVAKILEEEL
ncbi:TMEM175 family protein [Streptococcus sp. CSL10205-OR2]|uniref:TMEM175 family protein n=1 Tax=Streptococcus sp. CSL10205-OR2 TaxID=2980558 RepID=UPI0021D8129C|nr:TMEM175 family protein [Streptococcus sp. CSL10205-OR2]MCU9533809.1 TMEM175 family protein [Streptococcus sp. CSL10205-OR2]